MKRRKKPRVSATDELKLKSAEYTGELVRCWIQLAYVTPLYGRWTCSLAIALHLKRAIYVDRRELKQ